MKRKHKSFAIKPVAGMNSEINVTPLVDVVLVLLIIFMVVTPLLEKNIGVRTPTTEKVEEVQEVPPDQVVVYLDAKGGLRVNATVLTQAEFIGKMKDILSVRADKTVYVVAEDKVSYARFVAILDGSREAGATTLGFATDAPDPALFNN
jgi:biopolymer transport protein ExbD